MAHAALLYCASQRLLACRSFVYAHSCSQQCILCMLLWVAVPASASSVLHPCAHL